MSSVRINPAVLGVAAVLYCTVHIYNVMWSVDTSRRVFFKFSAVTKTPNRCLQYRNSRFQASNVS